MNYTTTLFLLAIISFAACKKSPRSYTSKMAGPHHWHGTESGTSYVSHSQPVPYNVPVSRIDTIKVYSDNAIEMDGKDFELVEENSSNKYLLFKEEFHGDISIIYYYSKNTFKYEANTGQSHIEMVSP